LIENESSKKTLFNKRVFTFHNLNNTLLLGLKITLFSYMQCPTCQNTDSRVLESRSADSGKSVRRRRECLNCSFRFTTYERVESMPISVIKKDGSRELFDKEKLFTGISRACEKTSFTSEAIINFVDGIESQIIHNSNKDIKTTQIGELILKNLRKENEVAYIRYASVYRKFNGVKDFISTLESLKGNSKNQLASIL
tara:strand:+ start:77 stop:667 length:591 start_codon:yes stop_codon:yes gene_type:complete